MLSERYGKQYLLGIFCDHIHTKYYYSLLSLYIFKSCMDDFKTFLKHRALFFASARALENSHLFHSLGIHHFPGDLEGRWFWLGVACFSLSLVGQVLLLFVHKKFDTNWRSSIFCLHLTETTEKRRIFWSRKVRIIDSYESSSFHFFLGKLIVLVSRSLLDNDVKRATSPFLPRGFGEKASQFRPFGVINHTGCRSFWTVCQSQNKQE